MAFWDRLIGGRGSSRHLPPISPGPYEGAGEGAGEDVRVEEEDGKPLGADEEDIIIDAEGYTKGTGDKDTGEGDKGEGDKGKGDKGEGDEKATREEKEAKEAIELGKKISKTEAEQKLEGLKREERAAKFKEKTAREKYKLERWGNIRKEFGETRAEVGKWTKGAATLGGVPALERKGGIRDMYFGKGGKELYLGGPGKDKSDAGKALQPDLSRLKEQISPNGPEAQEADRDYARQLVQPPGRRTGGGPLKYSFLKELQVPRGLSRLEQYAFSEIRANGDADNMSHIQDELARLGVPREQAKQAVESLERKGFVSKAEDRKGEPPIYEVAHGQELTQTGSGPLWGGLKA